MSHSGFIMLDYGLTPPADTASCNFFTQPIKQSYILKAQQTDNLRAALFL
jgi:hypothetical protein